MSDVVLAVRARDGDGRALEVLVERHEPGVRRLAEVPALGSAGRRGRRPGVARQAVHPDRPVPRPQPVLDVALQPRGEHVPRPRRAAAPAPAPAAGRRRRAALGRGGPHDLALQREQRRLLALRMADLSEEQRQVMVMKDVLSLSYEEIAEVLGMPVGTVKCHAHRGRARHAPLDDAGARGDLRVTRGRRRRSARAAIEAIIPHRDPFLLVDEITELEPGVRAAGRYHVKDEAWYLRGHFPGRPIMPGVLQVEALAQVGAVCGLVPPRLRGQARALRRHRRRALQADRRCRATRSTCGARSRACASRGQGDAEATVAGELACRADADVRADGARARDRRAASAASWCSASARTCPSG